MSSTQCDSVKLLADGLAVEIQSDSYTDMAEMKLNLGDYRYYSNSATFQLGAVTLFFPSYSTGPLAPNRLIVNLGTGLGTLVFCFKSKERATHAYNKLKELMHKK